MGRAVVLDHQLLQDRLYKLPDNLQVPVPLKAKVKFKMYKVATYTELADLQSGKLVNAYQNQMLTRLQALNQYQFVNSAVTVQQVLNTLAHTAWPAPRRLILFITSGP